MQGTFLILSLKVVYMYNAVFPPCVLQPSTCYTLFSQLILYSFFFFMFSQLVLYSFFFFFRLAKYQAFKSFSKRILVATDLFGRGMDIERVNIVFNYDMPENSDTYLHRVRITAITVAIVTLWVNLWAFLSMIYL